MDSKAETQAALMAAGINRTEKDIQDCEKIKNDNKKLKLECYRLQKIVMKQMNDVRKSIMPEELNRV
jgi:hypothetical protein